MRVLIGQQVKQFEMLLDGQRGPPEDQVLPVPTDDSVLDLDHAVLGNRHALWLPDTRAGLARVFGLVVTSRLIAGAPVIFREGGRAGPISVAWCKAKVDHRGLRSPASRSDPPTHRRSLRLGEGERTSLAKTYGSRRFRHQLLGAARDELGC